MSQKVTIECKPDGPYVVRGLANLRDSRGESIPAKPVLALCRCGGSANKPFCDGTHQKNGFSGARLAGVPAGERESYRGKAITIHDDRSLCAHAGRCTDGLAAVFKYGSEPWIDPDGATVEAVIETIRKCPSGALSYSLDGVEHRAEKEEPAITPAKDGPYEVAGAVRLVGEDGVERATTPCFTLCRCGGSKNKPFCDGTHASLGFKDP